MDLASECSAHESVEDNELTTPSEYSVTNLLVVGDDDDDDDGEVKAIGSCSIQCHPTVSGGSANSQQYKEGEESEHVGNLGNLSLLTASSPSAGSSPPTKGYGLKKWRRIKRDVVKDVPVNGDIGKVLKRPSSGNPTKPTLLSPAEIKQHSQGLVESANESRNVAFPDGFVNYVSSFESRFALGSAFTSGTDSENCDDRSSKSSTAASAPRGRNELPASSGYVWENNRIKNLACKWISSSAQHLKQVKGHAENSKKPRGERVKIEEENSHSCVESDSINSKFFFMQGATSVMSNGNLSERSTNSDGESSNEAHAVDEHFSQEIQTGNDQENAVEVEDLSSSWEDKEDNIAINQPSSNHDALVESIIALQSVQEALQSEVQKLGEIGEINTASSGIQESSSSDQLEFGSNRKLTSLESKVLCLTENVAHLESRLEEARTMLKLKESRVAELEATLNHGISPNAELGNTVELVQMSCREIESQLEGLFRQKIEGEIEHLALARTVQKFRIDLNNHIRETVSEQEKRLNQLGGTEIEENVLNKQAEELKKYKGDMLETEEVLKMQKGVFKVASYFFIQLILFVLILGLLMSQLPHSSFVVPT
ncbi:hypothetical protein K2173_015360 [Erythroxylum novogranatense]|uniref:WPP domain-interacting protein 1 n=1 Tax=Erythroxylum novogranatense TaxID=1862640 RepID=A0AAV8SSC3_9ROSI|nr:hypothetical protein K2173_015360 [Erythroxylum novogranatense]